MDPLLSRLSMPSTVIVTTLFIETMAVKAADMQGNSLILDDNWSIILVACVSSAAVLTLMVYTLIHCTDCYKSEVSSDNHPATASNGRKWGGAGGYSAAATSSVNDSVMSAGFTGEVVLPGESGNQGLPYAMIPSQVPEAQGFQGYRPSHVPNVQGIHGYGSTNRGVTPANVGSAGNGQWGGIGQQGEAWSHHRPGAHVSPLTTLEPQEPPPPYFEPSCR